MSVTLGAATLLALLILSAGASCWTIAILKFIASSPRVPQGLANAAAGLLVMLGCDPVSPLVPWSPRRPVPWGRLHVSAVFVVLAIPMVISLLSHWDVLPAVEANEAQSLSEKEQLVWFDSAIKLVLLAVAGMFIAVHTGARWRDFGFSARDLWTDLKIGLVGFVMLAPPVYAIQGLLVYFWKPSKHPLIEMFKESPDAGFFVVLFVAAAVVAPLFEELVFRVLLQGFLEKAFALARPAQELVFGSPTPPVAASLIAPALPAEPATGSSPEIVFLADPSQPDVNPYAPSSIAGEGAQLAELAEFSAQDELRGPAAWLPIAISTLIFALLHYTHGPDWVPLLLLAAGMGYLYQRTHRLVPSLIVHASLNSLSMFGLWLQIYALPEQGLGK